jgi:hypothetical protein
MNRDIHKHLSSCQLLLSVDCYNRCNHMLLLLLLLLQGVDYLFSPELSGVIDRSKCTTCMDPNSTACSGSGLDNGSHGALAVLHSFLSISLMVSWNLLYLKGCLDAFDSCVVVRARIAA